MFTITSIDMAPNSALTEARPTRSTVIASDTKVLTWFDVGPVGSVFAPSVLGPIRSSNMWKRLGKWIGRILLEKTVEELAKKGK